VWLKIKEAADYARLGQRTIEKALARDLPCVRVGRRVVINRDRLDEWMQRHEVVAPVSVRTRRTNPATRQRRSA
jgi:excisionase family DNA binding protein